MEDEIDLGAVVAKDNKEIPAEVMINKKRGIVLKEQIEDYREKLLAMINDKETYAPVVSAIQATLNTNPPEISEDAKGEKPTWESEHFEHLPLASVITILSKMQSDIRNVEAEMLGYLFSQIDAGSFKFNKIEPIVLESSDYVFRGRTYEARIFLAAYDSTQPIKVQLNGSSTVLEADASGKVVYSTTPKSTGLNRWGGVIVLEGDDQTIRKEFKETYMVAEASAVVSPTKMNVFYRGVANPVAISVSGVPKENIQAEITKGRISASGDEWKVMPAAGPENELVSVSVYANMDNSRKFMGSMDFRVKDVPPPVAKIAGRSQGAITLTQLTSASGVDAELENFLFDLDFTVTEFTVSAVLSGGFTKSEKSSNNKFTRAQMEILSQLGSGKTLTVTDIKAIGPDGKVRSLNSIVLKII